MNQMQSKIVKSKERKLLYHQTSFIALMTALMCILGPISIPIGAVPVSFTNFVIYIISYLLSTKFSVISCCIYLLIGTIGIPVFSGFSGGIAKLAGPTGGYLVGFIFMAAISGIFVKKFRDKMLLQILGMALGTLADYILGTVWFIIEARCNLFYALTVCVFPFLFADGMKIFAACKIGPIIRKALNKGKLLNMDS